MRDDIRARRSQSARDRIKDAIGAGIDTPVRARDPRDKAMFELEAIADALEENAQAEGNERLEDLTVPELKEIAKDNDVEGYSDMKKAELLRAIKAAG